jgi:hypothetical protein
MISTSLTNHPHQVSEVSSNQEVIIDKGSQSKDEEEKV